MTISYSASVSEGTFIRFMRVLTFWRGSVWKCVYQDLLVWMICYVVLSVVYRVGLNKDQQKQFELVVAFADKNSGMIPMSFLLGFYVQQVLQRWFVQFDNLGWIDSTALYLAFAMRGSDQRIRTIKRNIVRYLVLLQALVYRDISSQVRKRLPTDETVVAAGLCTMEEFHAFESVVTEQCKHFVPFHWAAHLVADAKKAGRIDAFDAVELMRLMNNYRMNLGTLLNYDWIPIPLAYTQVVFLTVRAYFLMALLGHQFVFDHSGAGGVRSVVDLYVPILGIMQFVFYMGWVKVAEALINPFGFDDDDFELNWILDRNLQVGLSIVDDCVGKEPVARKDMFWSDKAPEVLYSKDAINIGVNPRVGSAAAADEKQRKKKKKRVVVFSRNKTEHQTRVEGEKVSYGPPVDNDKFGEMADTDVEKAKSDDTDSAIVMVRRSDVITSNSNADDNPVHHFFQRHMSVRMPKRSMSRRSTGSGTGGGDDDNFNNIVDVLAEVSDSEAADSDATAKKPTEDGTKAEANNATPSKPTDEVAEDKGNTDNTKKATDGSSKVGGHNATQEKATDGSSKAEGSGQTKKNGTDGSSKVDGSNRTKKKGTDGSSKVEGINHTNKKRTDDSSKAGGNDSAKKKGKSMADEVKDRGTGLSGRQESDATHGESSRTPRNANDGESKEGKTGSTARKAKDDSSKNGGNNSPPSKTKDDDANNGRNTSSQRKAADNSTKTGRNQNQQTMIGN